MKTNNQDERRVFFSSSEEEGGDFQQVCLCSLFLIYPTQLLIFNTDINQYRDMRVWN